MTAAAGAGPAPLPSRFGRYEVIALLGQGGMGAVYKARDPVIDRTVAIKTINPLLLRGQAEREEFLERFRREARAAGRLSHPNIVSVHDLGADEATGTPFIVMEYVPGTSLETVLSENASLPVEQVVEVLEQVSAALAEAHRGGVIHRDVKPSNVFLDPRGRVKVGDFGVARLEGSELTQAGVGLGTPGYSAPEVLRSAPADARSDVFALGVLAYRALTGQRPFPATTPEAAAIEVLERSPPPPASVRPEIPEHISRAVMRALEKSRERRTPSAEAFAQDLRSGPVPATGAALVVPAPPAPVEPLPTATIAVPTVASARPTRRWVVALVLLGLAALAALALTARRGSDVPSATRSPQTTPAAAPRSRPVATPRARDTAPVSEPDRGIEGAAREAQRKAEERLREESEKVLEKQREDDKKEEGKHGGGKKGRGKGHKKN